MRNTILLSALMFLALLTRAQELTQTIRGTVYDEQSQSPLFGVNVVVLNSNPIIGATTDFDGKFVLEKVPVGRQALQVSYLGYEIATLQNLQVNSAKELVLEIPLIEKVTSVNEVVVTGNRKEEAINEIALASSRVLSMDEANRYSGTRSDPSRMAQNFAGVSGANDARNDIIIRGNSPAGVLWRMEGMDIPNPNHFGTLGATGGPVTMLNTNNLRNSDFLTGAFPSQYGNALAGVFDLRLRNGNSEKYEFLGQIGFNGFEAGAEGPFTKKSDASFIANYRYSTLGVMSALGLEFGTGFAVPQYQDLTFKVNVPTKNAGKFTLFGIGGMSYIEFLAEEETDGNLYAQDDRNQYYDSDMGVVGLSHTYFFSDKTYGRVHLSASAFRSLADEDVVDFENNTITDDLDLSFAQIKYSVGYTLNHKFNAKNQLTAGVNQEVNDLRLSQSELLDNNMYVTLVDFQDYAPLFQSYVNWQHRFSDKVTMNLGLHHQHFFLNHTWAVEPRANLKYQFRPKQSLTFAMGAHSQTQPYQVYFIEAPLADGSMMRTNDELDFTRSYHSVIGYENMLTEKLRFKVEAYSQYITGAPVEQRATSFSMLNAGADFGFPENDSLINDGSGYNYGLELTLEKFLGKGYYFLATASIFNSKYTGSDEEWRNTAFNGNYVFNALGGKEFKVGKLSTLGFDIKMTVAGGQRYTPIDMQASAITGETEYDESKAYSEQNDVYFRPDLKLTYGFNGKRVTQKFSVDLQNFIGYKNVFSREYDADSGTVEETYQIGFFPDVQYRILF